MKEYRKEKVVSIVESVVLVATSIPVYMFVIRPFLVANTPISHNSGWDILALLTTVTLASFLYAVLRNPRAWYRIVMALFFGADYTHNGDQK